MANHTKQLLNTWYPKKDDMQWVLATIIETQGSSYRKPGAMMMINSLGKYHGLLSGGCLESDIMRQSRQCWETGNNKIIQYDMREEEDLAWQLGIGCGGLVRILLQAVSAENDYLQLLNLRDQINQNKGCEYTQALIDDKPINSLQANVAAQHEVFVHHILPPPHIAVFGGGVDAVPLVNIAATLGWQITLVDARPSYARAAEFKHADHIIKHPIADLSEATWLTQIDAAVVMMHNVELDAQALTLLQYSAAKYVGLLGPTHRTDRVLQQAALKHHELRKPLANPIGLRLGGELPESIALSIVAEIHAFLEQADGLSISQVFT